MRVDVALALEPWLTEAVAETVEDRLAVAENVWEELVVAVRVREEVPVAVIVEEELALRDLEVVWLVLVDSEAEVVSEAL